MPAHYQKLNIVMVFILLLISLLIVPLNSQRVHSIFDKISEINTTNEETKDQFPFVGQRTLYDVVQKSGSLVGATGTLEVSYESMTDDITIQGRFHVLVTSLLEFYNENASGYENLKTRHLNIDASGTYIINLFMVYFFDWSSLTPTPMWIFPSEIAVNSTVQFWNYTATCEKSQSIALMKKYYEVFVFHVNGSFLDMTLMYGYGRHGNSDWYGLLFYFSASFYEPSIKDYLTANFKIIETNVELKPLREINRTTIYQITISFYFVVGVSIVIFRLRKRRDLVGGEV